MSYKVVFLFWWCFWNNMNKIIVQRKTSSHCQCHRKCVMPKANSVSTKQKINAGARNRAYIIGQCVCSVVMVERRATCFILNHFLFSFKIEKYLNNYTVNYILWIDRNKISRKKKWNLLDKVMHAPENVLKYQNNNPLLTFFLAGKRRKEEKKELRTNHNIVFHSNFISLQFSRHFFPPFGLY